MHRSAFMQKCLKLSILLSWNYTKNAKFLRSAVKEISQKVAGPRSLKHAKKVAGTRSMKMPKTRKSAVTEEYKYCISNQLCNNSKNFQFRGKKKKTKMDRSAVMQTCLKLIVLLSQNDTKNAKSHRATVKEKCQKFAGPQSLKHAKRSQVRGLEKCQKLPDPRSQKNTKIS